jgi:hypothetical protein
VQEICTVDIKFSCVSRTRIILTQLVAESRMANRLPLFRSPVLRQLIDVDHDDGYDERDDVHPHCYPAFNSLLLIILLNVCPVVATINPFLVCYTTKRIAPCFVKPYIPVGLQKN